MKSLIPTVCYVIWEKICVRVDFVSYAVREAIRAIHAVLVVDDGGKSFVIAAFAKNAAMDVMLARV